MQLEDLQKQWQQLDKKLERTLLVNTALLRHVVVGTTHKRISRWMIWPSMDIAASVFVAIFAIAFVTDHWADWALLIPAVVLLAGAIALCVSSVRQIIVASEMDWAGPVVSLQQSLTLLRVLQTRQNYWILLTSPIVGFCGLIVVLQWLLDFLPEPHFILEKLNQRWLWSNIVFGVVILVAGYLTTKYFSKRFRKHAWWKSFEDSLSGRTVVQARDELDQWILGPGEL